MGLYLFIEQSQLHSWSSISIDEKSVSFIATKPMVSHRIITVTVVFSVFDQTWI